MVKKVKELQHRDYRFFVGVGIIAFDLYVVYVNHIATITPWDAEEKIFHGIAFAGGLMLALQPDIINKILEGVISFFNRGEK